MRPADLLDESRVVLGIDATLSKEEVLEALLTTAFVDDESAGVVVSQLISREGKMTTGIGRGVAVPHTRSSTVKEPLAVLGVSPGGLDFAAIDGERVHIIFAFITPESIPSLHISTLAEAVRVFGSPSVREAILAAESPREVIEILSDVAPAQAC